tara:strand:+ start:1211 stop:1360 length:150 start_codon:yes stop_codon:yes gene_type:complete
MALKISIAIKAATPIGPPLPKDLNPAFKPETPTLAFFTPFPSFALLSTV